VTPGEFYRRELDRQLLGHGLLGPVYRGGICVVVIPPASALAEMVADPIAPEAEAWLRRRLAEFEPTGGSLR
jgi:hypothetical protein